MPFNPYNHEAYQGIGNSAFSSLPESTQQTITSAAISGLNYFLDVRKEAEESARKAAEWHMSQDRRLHKNGRSALEGGLASDMINGQRDCSGNDDWNFNSF
jgi:hypothetical protein